MNYRLYGYMLGYLRKAASDIPLTLEEIEEQDIAADVEDLNNSPSVVDEGITYGPNIDIDRVLPEEGEIIQEGMADALGVQDDQRMGGDPEGEYIGKTARDRRAFQTPTERSGPITGTSEHSDGSVANNQEDTNPVLNAINDTGGKLKPVHKPLDPVDTSNTAMSGVNIASSENES